ncbi:MAG: FAD-binding protein [Victivallales bacterium]|nr:FAD-binding protein [Victivallales bacterium]
MRVDTLVIGSGAAGLAAALNLSRQGVENIAVFTEGLKMGTSINTGSDKQTYYKLGMYGKEPDAPALMARDMAAGGSCHGDIAYIEAALSPLAFHNLVLLGVPFPHDEYGQHIGYKTDHDPKRRATSCGPYTSRDMCRALIAEVQRRNIPVFQQRMAVKLLVHEGNAVGAIFMNLDTGELETVQAQNTVFAVGGPGGLYETSVYPKVHTGAIGLALEAGACACNLAESQFGLASIKFRWNVSGSYMQTLPRFVSTDADGNEPREFLRDYFDSVADMYNAIFRKGYQWPFSAGNVPGSSLIDIFTYIETVQKGRRVWLDYRKEPEDLRLWELSAEAREYLERSNATQGTPLERLAAMNSPAIELYRKNSIDLSKEPLEIAVCAQHNNGGLEGDVWWQSVNIRHLFPIGEVNGSHGVTRPGGTALNAGQVGALRASEYIANSQDKHAIDDVDFEKLAFSELEKLIAKHAVKATLDWRTERAALQRRMSKAGAFIRSEKEVAQALDDGMAQLAALDKCGLNGLASRDCAELLRTRQLCIAHVCYLASILEQCKAVGSRGGSIVLSASGKGISPKLGDEWQIMSENIAYRDCVMQCKYVAGEGPGIAWEQARPIPETDGWFERVWADFRNKAIYKRGI